MNPSDPCVVDDLGRFVAAAGISHVSEGARRSLERNVLDTLGCAIAADGEVITAIREQVCAAGATPAATLIGGGGASVEQATLLNSVRVRYLDLLDTYLAPGGLCHPADNFAAILAVAEQRRASGEDLLLALALAYEIQCRFSARVPVMARGLNHALQLALSVAAGSARLMELDAERAAHAIAIAAADNVSLSVIHSEPVSNWKGISPGVTAQRAVSTTALAARGITGPRGLFEGPNGLDRLLEQTVDLDLSDPSLDVVEQTHLKKYCALIHGQPVIETVLHLAGSHGLSHHDVAEVRLEVFQAAYDIAGGGRFGDKSAPRTKEQADYNLKYLTAVALIDGQVGPDQLCEDRVRRDDVQSLLRRVEVVADESLTAGYPLTTPVRVHIGLTDGRRWSREQTDFEGAPTRPLSWDRVVEKFHWLTEPYADDALRAAVVAAVADLDTISIAMLTSLLARVRRTPERPRSRQPV